MDFRSVLLLRNSLTILVFFLTAISFAQSPDDLISVSGINEKYLEHLVKEKIDEVRSQHRLKALANDSILYVAAKFHSNYLFKKGKLSHTEAENPITETPQKRVEYFGAVNYLVGENIALTYISIPTKDKKGNVHTNQTYDQTATDLVTMWVHSPGHFKNIITPEYNSTGLAVWLDPKTNAVYAVQKFADVRFKYSFEENRSFFPYSNYISPPVTTSFREVDSTMHDGKHVWKLKQANDTMVCQRCKENAANFAFGETRLEHKGSSIYLTSYSIDAIFKLLKKRKDGFAAEIVTYTPFDCGNPRYYTRQSRRNKECIFNGVVLKPIYKKQALKGFHPGGKNEKEIEKTLKAGKGKRYSLKLGNVPKGINDYYEVNLIVIQKKRVCRIMHFSGFCGDTLDRFYPLSFFSDSISNHSAIKESYKNIQFSIRFQKGKTEYSISDLKPITDSLLSENFAADTIEIRAFSSIEGTETINNLLQSKRAGNIAGSISAMQDEKLTKIITAKENWFLFENQVNEHAELRKFKGISHEKVKLILEDTLEARKIEKYLTKQRIAHIRLHAKVTITDKTIERYLSGKIKLAKAKITKLTEEINRTQELSIHLDKKSATIRVQRDSLKTIRNRQIDSLTCFMEVGYNKIKQGVISPEFFDSCEEEEAEIFNKYNLLRLKYWIQIHPPETRKEWYGKVYHDLVSLYNHNEKSFFINYNMLNIYQQHGNEINASLEDKQVDNYITELRSLAADSTEKELTNWVYELLLPEYQQRKNNPEGLRILAKTLYQNYEESGNTEYYEFLKDLSTIIGKDQWCPMFIGPCNISFQAFDYEKFRNFYCERCNDYVNYVKSSTQKK
jgi:uncharacterized protein YkwD